MAAIKFSKQYIEPNPNEIDYWVDLSSNQYGGRMKYHNGFEWVDLVNPDGTHIDINDFYNKLQKIDPDNYQMHLEEFIYKQKVKK